MAKREDVQKQMVFKANDLKSALDLQANSVKAKILSRFFKTGKGEYGEGDIFLGITVPKQREIAKKFREISLDELLKVLKSKIHEYRLTSLLILLDKYQRGDSKLKDQIYKVYLDNTEYINNWDLIDTSARDIVGEYVYRNEKAKILLTLAKSNNLWKKRISVIASWYFIREDKFDLTLELVGLLMDDKHDLIHKACGWMLREVGKRDEKVLLDFLDENAYKMPRTALRYSIEKLSREKREYMLGLRP